MVARRNQAISAFANEELSDYRQFLVVTLRLCRGREDETQCTASHLLHNESRLREHLVGLRT